MESETCLSEEVEGDLKVDNHTARTFLFHRTKFNYEIVPRIAQWRCAPQLGTFYWTVVVCFFPLLEQTQNKQPSKDVKRILGSCKSDSGER